MIRFGIKADFITVSSELFSFLTNIFLQISVLRLYYFTTVMISLILIIKYLVQANKFRFH